MNAHNTRLSYLILMLFITKISWICAVVVYTYLNTTSSKYTDYALIIEDTIHSIFTLLIGIMLIYLFNHLTTDKVCVTGHTKMQLYMLGIFTILGVIKAAAIKYHFIPE
jgi:hypothetical protein